MAKSGELRFDKASNLLDVGITAALADFGISASMTSGSFEVDVAEASSVLFITEEKTLGLELINFETE